MALTLPMLEKLATPQTCSVQDCASEVRAKGLCQKHLLRLRRRGSVEDKKHPSPARDHFYEVVMPYEGDDCLVWPFARDAKGYGTIVHNGKNAFVHRVACLLRNGEAPSPLHQAAHNCGNGRGGCCNPNHVRWATASENHMDKVKHGTDHRGAKNPRAKITQVQALEIMALKGTVSALVVAKKYGISRSAVTAIWRGERWYWLQFPKPGNHVSRLPTKSAQTNAALIASIMKAKEGRE